MNAKVTLVRLAILSLALISIGFAWGITSEVGELFHAGLLKQDVGPMTQTTQAQAGMDNTPCILYLINYSDDRD